VVEFAKRDDMKYALDKLNGDKLLGHRLDLEEAVCKFIFIKPSIFINVA
jgi:RNA recognition motif-containing protein